MGIATRWTWTLAVAVVVGGCGPATDDERLTVGGGAQLLASSGSAAEGVNLRVIASVTPPTVNGVTVQANNFWLGSNVAHVAYNNQGLPIVGAIDVIELVDPARPRLLAHTPFPTTKINAVAVSDGHLYYAGMDEGLGAALGKVVLQGHTLGSQFPPTVMPSYAGTGLVTLGETLYATSGDTGGLSWYSTELAVQRTVPIADSRSVSLSPDGRRIGVVTGQPGSAAFFHPDGSELATHTLGGASIAESKSTIQMGNRLTLVSLGEAGFSVLCTQTGAVLASQPAVVLPGVPPESTVTNAAAAGPGLVFTANGHAGVYVYRLTAGALIPGTNCNQQTLEELGHLALDSGQYSANMVFFRNNYLFLADGLGGFRVLSVENVSGTGGENDFVSPGTGLVVLNGQASGALKLDGNGKLKVVGGGIYVNSTSSSALSATGNANATAATLFIGGSPQLKGNATLTGSVVTGAAPMEDPLAWLPVPSTAGLTTRATQALQLDADQSVTLEPGEYQGGIHISGNAQVTLQPGLYYLSQGGLTVSGNGSLQGESVLLYNASTSEAVNLSGNGAIALSPMREGTWAGVTLFQNRASTQKVTISGNGSLNIVGSLYAPSAPLSLSGNGGLPILGSLNVAHTVTITGNGTAVIRQ